MSEPRTDALPESDPPVSDGVDSVQVMHSALMQAMNDPVMSFTGEEDDEMLNARSPGHADSIQAIHDVFMREHSEPRDGFEPVPFWVAIVCGGLLVWSGYYLGTNSVDFRRDVFDRSDLRPAALRPPDLKEPDPKTVAELMKIGAQVYGTRCTSCHGPEGKGGQGVPPLAGSEWVIGAEASVARQSRIALYGVQGEITVKGVKYNANMPAWGMLRDYEIASVLTYIRNSWGNSVDHEDSKPGITVEAIAATRAKESLNRLPFTESELKTIPLNQSDLIVHPKK